VQRGLRVFLDVCRVGGQNQSHHERTKNKNSGLMVGCQKK